MAGRSIEMAGRSIKGEVSIGLHVANQEWDDELELKTGMKAWKMGLEMFKWRTKILKVHQIGI